MFHTKKFFKITKICALWEHILKPSQSNITKCNASSMGFCSSSNDSFYKDKKVEELFIKPEIQKILKKITTLDYDKVFASTPGPLVPHKYEFVTDKRLKELQDEAAAQASEKLQMPPVLALRKPINEVLSKDPLLQGYLRNKIIFTDISPNASSRHRLITVRETDGTLRKATWEERDRMNQIFYPIPGRNLEIPKLYESPYLERLLEEGSYVFVLDSACAQFEPDHPVYHRVTFATFEHIKSKKAFDELRSTRHFGPMAFYYSYTKSIDPLLIDMIERNLISDAADTVKLLYAMHEELGISPKIDVSNNIAVIEDYIENHAVEKSKLELAMQTHFEQNTDVNKEMAI